MSQEPAKIHEMLAKLRSSFREKMVDRLILIENASVQLNSAPNDATAMACIKRECHKLSGVSKSLGFVEIGDLATDIDCAISQKSATWDEIQPIVEALLDQMELELD